MTRTVTRSSKGLLSQNSRKAKFALASAAALAAMHFGTSSVQAQSGTWSFNGTGNWSDVTAWTGGIVADGANNTADISTVNITAAQTIHLDSARTIGNIVIGDLVPNNNWVLDNNAVAANTLTLATTTGTPTINVVNQSLFDAVAMLGTGGMLKSGAGALWVRATNTYTGNTTVNSGVLRLDFNNTNSPLTDILYNGVTKGQLIINGGAVDINGRASNTVVQTFGGAQFNAGASAITEAFRQSSGSDRLVLGAVTRSVGATAIFNSQGSNNAYISTTTANGASGVLGGWALNGGNPTEFARASGTAPSGGLNITGGATYTNAFTSNAINTDMTADLSAATDAVTGTVRFITGSARTLTLSSTGTANTIATGGILVGATTGANVSTITGGTLTSGNGGDLIVSQYNPSAALVINSVVANSGATPIGLTKSGVGSLVLGGNNLFTGNVFINGGAVVVNNAAALNAAGTNVVNFASDVGTITANGGSSTTFSGNIAPVLRVNGFTSTIAGINTTNAPLGNAMIENASTSAGTLVYNSTNSSTFNGVMQNGAGGGAFNLTKSGNSTLTLQGINTYTGVTTVSASGGTLLLSSAASTNSISSSSIISVGTSANLDVTGLSGGAITLATGQTITGSGRVRGGLIAGSGAGISSVTPGTSGIGVLNTDSFTLNANATLNYEFNGSGNDQVAVINNNGLTINGGKFNLYTAGGITPWSTTGTFTLLTYAGSVQGTGVSALTSASILNPVAGLSYAFTDVSGLIKLTISGSASTANAWNKDFGQGDGKWSTASNWSTGVVPQNAGDTANFDSAITSARTVTLDANESVGVLGFNNLNKYTIAPGSGTTLTLDSNVGAAQVIVTTGSHEIAANVALADTASVVVSSASSTLTVSGSISGSGAINKTGSGVLALSASNSYTGGTSVSGGTVLFSSNDSLGSGTLTVAGGALKWAVGNTADISTHAPFSVNGTGATLDTNGNDVVLANPIGNSGPGTLIKTGAGKLTLANANTFTGGVSINAGTLAVADDSAFGPIPGAATPNITFNAGAGNVAALQAAAPLTIADNRSINLSSGTAVIDTNGNAVGIANAVISGGGGLRKTGDGVLTLTGVNTYTGGTRIEGGEISLGQSNAAAVAGVNNSALGTGPITLAGGTLTMTAFSGNTNGTFSGTLPNALIVPAGQTGALNVSQRGASSGNLTGSGTLNLGVQYVRGDLLGDWSAFTGTINVSTPGAPGGVPGQTGDFRVNNMAGYANAHVILGDSVQMYQAFNFALGSTFDIGELSSTSTSAAIVGNTNGRALTYRIGGLNTSATYAGRILAANALVKQGTGTLTLTNIIATVGTIAVNGGTLDLLNGADLLQIGTVTVNNGGTLLLNGGTISSGSASLMTTAGGSIKTTSNFNTPSGGSVGGSGTFYGNLNANSGSLIAGTVGAAGTFSIAGNLHLQNSNVPVDLGATTTLGGGTNDLISVTGDLDTSGNNNQFSVNFLGVPAAVGSIYPVMNYTGTLTGDPSQFAISSNNARITLGADTSIAKTIGLKVLAYTPGVLLWSSQQGAGTANWDANIDAEFTNTVTAVNPDKFYNGDSVTFGDGLSTVTAVTINGLVQPSSVTFNSNVNAYTIAVAGGGRITGTGSLTKSGTSILTFGVANDYSGGTTVNGGTIATGGQAGNALGTGPITLNGGAISSNIANTANFAQSVSISASASGTLAINNATGIGSITGSLSGTGSLNIVSDTAGKQIDLAGNNTAFTGTVVVRGAVKARVGGGSTGTNAIWNIADNGTFSTTAGVATGTTVVPLGGLVGSATSTLRGYDAGGTGGVVAYQIGGANVATTFAGSVINGFSTLASGGGVRPTAIIKSGTSTLTLSGSNSYTGGNTIQSGTLALAGVNAWTPSLTGPNTFSGGKLVFDYTTGGSGTDPVTSVVASLQASYAGGWATGVYRLATVDAQHGIGYNDLTGSNKLVLGYAYYGDANLDRFVNTLDFNALAGAYNTSTGGTWAAGDFNYDGRVNLLDFNQLATNFGQTVAAGDVVPGAVALGSLVPEPTTLGLAALAGAMVLPRRRRQA